MNDDMYSILPDDIDNLEDLEQWKNKFESMTYYQRNLSNDEARSKYGKDNITRYDELTAKLNSEKPNDIYSINKDEPTIGSSTVIGAPKKETVKESSTVVAAPHTPNALSSDDLFFTNWDDIIARVRSAEASGLLIMINTDNPERQPKFYIYDDIEYLKDKWNRYNSLSSDMRVLSSQTAENILGLNNKNLYTKILNRYDSNIIESANLNKDDIKILPYFTVDEMKNMKISYSESTIDNPNIKSIRNYYLENGKLENEYLYSRTLYELGYMLETTKDHSEKQKIKQTMLEIGWNPEIPISEESIFKVKQRHNF